jgi:DNA-binding NarL/FixJ family response regulator
MKNITILLADDHLIVRQGMRALLGTVPCLEVIGEAEDGRQAVDLAAALRPDVVVMDIGMPLLNGLQATRLIKANTPATKVLVLSSYSDDRFVQELAEAGAVGFLHKQTTTPEFIAAIRRASEGKASFSPSISARFTNRYRQAILRDGKPPKGQFPVRLKSRECEVVQMLAQGKTNRQMAIDLNISVKTVGKHRQSAMNKLNIHDVAGMTRYAIREGIVANPGIGMVAERILAPLPNRESLNLER